MRRSALMVCLASSTTCRAPAGAPDAGALLPVELAGCALEERDGTCTLPQDRRLRLFVPEAFSAPQIEGAERVTATTVQGGVRLEVEVDEGARSLVVRADGRGGEAWASVSLRGPEASPLDAVIAAKHAGDLATAEATLDALRPTLSGREAARATGLFARLTLARGRHAEAERAFRAAIAQDRALGLVSQEMADASALSFLLTTRASRLQEAQAVLSASRDAAEHTADGRARFPYFEGLVAFELGDLRRALSLFRASHEAAERLGLDAHAATARDRVAAVLDALGRSREAIAELSALRDRTAGHGDCDEADARMNLGWFLLEQPARSAHDLARARHELMAARALFPAGCADPHRAAIAATNQGFVALAHGELAAAAEALAAARAGLPDQAASLSSWWHVLEGELALAQGRARAAREAFARALARPEPDTTQRALLGEARALVALGEPEAALARYEAAEARLAVHALSAPLGEGRAAFLARHADSAREAVALSLSLGRPVEALAYARRARARLLRALEQGARLRTLDASQRARWAALVEAQQTARLALAERVRIERDLPRDQLALTERARRADELARTRRFEASLAELSLAADAPEPALPRDVLTLVFHEGTQGYVGFSVERGVVRAQKLGSAPSLRTPDTEAAWLLAPFAAELARARRVDVLAEGAVAEVDVHALPFRGAPLLAHADVRYRLDVGQGRAQGAPTERALVVADPAENLPQSRREAAQVAHALTQKGHAVSTLLGERADVAAVSSALTSTRHVHFAGHALFKGQDGWESALGLARGTRLSVGDLLGLDAPLDSVVLSSCEAATTHREALRGLSVADAFVLTGASLVIAPNRQVGDEETARLMERLYASDGDLAEALRDAQRAARAEGAHDWSAFRVTTP